MLQTRWGSNVFAMASALTSGGHTASQGSFRRDRHSASSGGQMTQSTCIVFRASSAVEGEMEIQKLSGSRSLMRSASSAPVGRHRIRRINVQVVTGNYEEVVPKFVLKILLTVHVIIDDFHSLDDSLRLLGSLFT